MKRSFVFWIYFIVAIILATYFSTRIIMSVTGRGPVSRIRTISVSADKTDKDLTTLAAAAGVAGGTNTYSVNLVQINDRVANVPGVKTSAVRRMPNGNLSINAELHRAIALWGDGDNYYPLASDGTIVQRPTQTRQDDAVLFRGKIPANVEKITKAAHTMADRLDYMEWIENRRWNLYTRSGITVMLPEIDPDAAISTLVLLDKNNGILSKDIKTIDMRDNARILVK